MHLTILGDTRRARAPAAKGEPSAGKPQNVKKCAVRDGGVSRCQGVNPMSALPGLCPGHKKASRREAFSQSSRQQVQNERPMLKLKMVLSNCVFCLRTKVELPLMASSNWVSLPDRLESIRLLPKLIAVMMLDE